jgi:ABC-type sugar transport system ATPase subunit
MNFVDGVFEAGGVRLSLPGAPLVAVTRGGAAGQAVTVGMRPEHLAVTAAETPGAIPARIGAVEPTGSTTYLFTDGAPELLVTTEGTARHRTGEAIGLTIPPERVHLFDPDTGLALPR